MWQKQHDIVQCTQDLYTPNLTWQNSTRAVKKCEIIVDTFNEFFTARKYHEVLHHRV